jgi:hypothetical protein
MWRRLLAYAGLFGALNLSAQWAPYTGTHTTEVRYTNAAGQVVRQDTVTATEHRTSKGFFRRDSPAGDRYYIWNPESAEAIYLVHASKSARVEKMDAAAPAEYGPHGTPLRQEMVGCNPCAVFPIVDEMKKPIGELCFSSAHKVTLRREIRTPAANEGQAIRVETRSLRFEEPQGVSFAMPDGYQSPVTPCANCRRR